MLSPRKLDVAGRWFYRAAIWFVGLFTLAHLVALPLSISYDGFLYLDLSDVLFSPRFPAAWHFARTPLYPLTLKLAFWLFGRNAMAAIAVSTAMGLGGILLLGIAVRHKAGEIPAAITLVLASLLPTLVTYQHFVLTETGTFFFLTLTVVLLLWRPETVGGLWAKAGLLIVAIATGYYWRQTLLPLAVVAALLHGIAAWKVLVPPYARWSMRRLAAVAAQVTLIATLPFVVAKPWSRYTDESRLRWMMISQGILCQALLPPDHPCLGDKSRCYREAIAAGAACGNFYSGTMGLPHGMQLVSVREAWKDRCVEFFFELIWQNPGRYCAAVGRMVMLTAGCHARVNEMENACTMVLSPDWHATSNTIGEGPAHLQAIVRRQFTQATTPSFLMRTLWNFHDGFGRLTMFAMAIAVVGVLAGLVLRSLPLVTLYGVPLAFQVPYILTLAAVDRYAFPTQTVALAVLPAFPVLVWQAIAARRGRALAVAVSNACFPFPQEETSAKVA